MGPDKKILFISLTDAPNGAENVLLTMAKEVGKEIWFLKRNQSSNLRIPDHIQAHYLSEISIARGFMQMVPRLWSLTSADLIISTHPYLNALLGLLKRIGYLKTKLIARECTSVFTRFTGLKKKVYQVLYRLGYPAIDLLVCQTEMMKQQLLNHNHFIPASKVLVQPNPIDFVKIKAGAEKPLINGDAKLDFICSAGRLIPEKGFPVLIEAFKNIKTEYPNLKLLLLGEGKERASLTQLIETNGLIDDVILKGQVNNPAPYFKHAKVCVVSSLKEGFPNVLLEMMAVNASVVSTLCAGGIEDIPGISKIEVNNVEALSNAMREALQKNKLNEENVVLDYLAQRKPEIFAHAILNALNNLN